MAEYLPPTEDVAIFDTLNFNDGNAPLTYNKAVKYFLRYPNAQGTENLQITNVNGLLTANAGIKTQTIEQIAIGTTQNLFTQGTALVKETAPLNIATGARDASAIVTINSNASSSAPTYIGGAGTSGIYFSGNANYGVGATNTLNMATNQTTGILNIGTGARSGGGSGGAINIGTGSASAGSYINIGTGTRTIADLINIGFNSGTGSSAGPVNINSGTNNSGGVLINTGTSNTGVVSINNNNITTATNIGGFTITGGTMGSGSVSAVTYTSGSGNACRFGNNITTGEVQIVAQQTSGSLRIADGGTTRTYATVGNNGGIHIGTGAMNGLAGGTSSATGCHINIGTGTHTLYSDMNIGTGNNDATTNINIGTGGTNAGHLHLQDGNNNTGNVHIANGTSNAGNVNICNNGGTGVINMGALGRAVEFSSTYTQASDFYRLGWYDLTTSTFTPNTTVVTTIAQTPSLPPGTWLVNVFYGYQTLAQVKRTYSISLTAGVHDTLHYIENFNVAGANGNLREAFSAVVEITISSAPILFLASNGTSTTSTNGSCYMSWTRIG